MFSLVSGYLARGVPIDGVGFQGHFDSKHLPAIDGIIDKLNRFAQLGLELQVTEFDIDQMNIDPQTQADFTRDFYRTLYANPDVNAITHVWGFGKANIGDHRRMQGCSIPHFRLSQTAKRLSTSSTFLRCNCWLTRMVE